MSSLHPWLVPQWDQWRLSLEAERFSNVTLLVSPDGYGSESLVQKLSDAVMCVNSLSEPCGFCHACDLMKANNHPDLHVIKPEKPGGTITVDQIRQCNRYAQETSQLSGYRLIVIEPAQAMNEAAANALLKTLETPAEKCLFLLVADKASQLLPTIVSRCQQWVVTPPSAAEVTQWLHENDVEKVPTFAAHINGCAPLTTLSFINEGGLKRYSDIECQFFLMLKKSPVALLELGKMLATKPDESLKWLWFLFVDAQKCHFSMSDDSYSPKAQSLALIVGYDSLYRHAASLRALHAQLASHSGLNAELLILNWLMEFNEDVCL